MAYVLKISAASGTPRVLFTLDEAQVKPTALDVFFDLLGSEHPEALVSSNSLPANQLEDFKTLQGLVFDRDAQGLFIRDGVSILQGEVELNPDRPLIEAFVPAEREGLQYQRLELSVRTPQAAPAPAAASPAGPGAEMNVFAHMMFLHQAALGHGLDVTKDYPDFGDIIKQAEKDGEVAIDVPTASYRLTPKGERLHQSWIDEAQDLLKRYDIFGDVEVDSTGRARFDTGRGEDWRVAVFELRGVDPFRARFLLGLNDGEWDALETWRDAVLDAAWYGEIFQPVETAPGVEDVGRDRLARVVDQAHTELSREVR